MAKRIQYDVTTTGISNAQALERVSYDKFQPQITPPQSNWAKAALYSVALIPFFFFDSSIKGITVFSSGTNAIVEQQMLQYQSRAFVPLVTSTTTPDKWLGSRPDYIFKLKNITYTYPSEFRTEIITPVSESINSESYHPDKIFDLKRQQYLYPNFTGDTNVLPLSRMLTSVVYPDKIFDLKKQQYTYPNFFFDTALKGITVFSPATNIITYPQTTQYQSRAFVPVVETITPDKWLGNKPDYIFKLKNITYTYPSDFRTEIVTPVSEPINAESNHPDY